MTNKEILANFKKSYNNLYDVRENGCDDHCNGQLPNYYQELLDHSIHNISSLYIDLISSMNLSEIQVPLEKLTISNVEDVRDVRLSSTIDTDYEIVLNNGDSEYVTCVDVDYTWYADYEYQMSETKNIQSNIR